MSTPREILERVAKGELSPQEAADLLEDSPSQAPSDATLRSIQLRGAFRSATIVADPTVKAVNVEGQHAARIDGDVLMIDADLDPGEGFRFEGRKGRKARRTIHIGVENPRPDPLVVRANPALDVVAEISAGSLKILGMQGKVRAEVSAGSLSIEDTHGPLDLSTAAGPIRVTGRFVTGEHRIRCEAGAVKVILLEGSDVEVNAKASLGKVSLPGSKAPSGFSVGDAHASATVGHGTAKLQIECALGAIKVALAGDDDDRSHRSTTSWETR